MSQSATDTLVVIPTYNERETIDSLIDALRAQQLAVLVVDDNSPDGTGKLVQSRANADSKIHVLTRAKKSGLGSAYREGFAWALDHEFPVVIQMDADGSHDPRAVASLVQLLAKNDLVIGSRYCVGGSVQDWSLFRKIVSRLGNWYINAILHLKNRNYKIKDSTSGFKAWRLTALQSIEPSRMKSDGYAFQIETTWEANRQGLCILETPITFRDRTVGSSKIGRSNIIDTFLLPWRL